jgi:hypothetical protein
MGLGQCHVFYLQNGLLYLVQGGPHRGLNGISFLQQLTLIFIIIFSKSVPVCVEKNMDILTTPT